MKKLIRSKVLIPTLLSMMVFVVFVLLAVGSGELSEMNSQVAISVEEDFLDNGNWQETENHYKTDVKRVYEGQKDSLERWHGKVVMESYEKGELIYTETMYMSHGVIQGLLTRKFTDGRPDEEEHYYNGNRYDFSKAAHTYASSTSAFNIFTDRYPYFLRMLEPFGFDSLYVVKFLNTVETMLAENTFTKGEFDDYYSDVLDSLSNTPYDSIVFYNSALSHIQGMKDIKNDEFRMAVVMRYWTNSEHTYDVVEKLYPKYLIIMDSMEISKSDFEDFCNDLDDTLDTYYPLNKEDPFFVDSIDSYLWKSLSSIINTEESASSVAQKVVSRKLSELFSKNINEDGIITEIYNHVVVNATSQEVAETVAMLIIMEYYQGDLMKKVVKESWSKNNSIASPAILATEKAGNISNTSVEVNGYIIDDGGASVTSKGIVWAESYNPTLDDNVLHPTLGTNTFNVTLAGLEEGKKYYARAFATNSAGTSYGNCIDFIVGSSVGLSERAIKNPAFDIYPNPTESQVKISFTLFSAQDAALSLYDLNGKLVLQRNAELLFQGQNELTLDVSGLSEGVYFCQLSTREARITKKLIITR